MTEKVEILEEQAEVARARLKQRFANFSDQYSLVAFKQAGRQLNNGRETQSVSSAFEALTKNPASSALLALAAGQLFKSQQTKEPTRSGELAVSTEDGVPEKSLPNNTAAQKSAMSWARQHPILSGATALAIGIGAGYVLINGRRQTPKG